MSNVPFSQRLGAFKQRFQQVLGNRGSGYDELAQLEQPLVGDDSGYGGNDDYQRAHGVSAPGQYTSFGRGGGGGLSGNSALPGLVTQTIPSQVRQLVPCVQFAGVFKRMASLEFCQFAREVLVAAFVIRADGDLQKVSTLCQLWTLLL